MKRRKKTKVSKWNEVTIEAAQDYEEDEQREGEEEFESSCPWATYEERYPTEDE